MTAYLTEYGAAHHLTLSAKLFAAKSLSMLDRLVEALELNEQLLTAYLTTYGAADLRTLSAKLLVAEYLIH